MQYHPHSHDYVSTSLSPELNKYYNKIVRMVTKSIRPHVISKILDHLYLGSMIDCTNKIKLQNLGVTHVINTAEHNTAGITKEWYGHAVEYMGFSSDDDDKYPIMQHFQQVFEFIEMARKCGGTCFIHCMAGINRSGVLATAYVMVHKDIGPITAVEYVLKRRGTILTNRGFIEALITFANDIGLLNKDANNKY